uniref:ORF121 n=1 Tax=Malaco herpesvirus 1 TaxID=3031797 RepID=A0AA48P857_9VIRU|nr:TPA_asm: ORF121 [Malaco herpesvirus 1]
MNESDDTAIVFSSALPPTDLFCSILTNKSPDMFCGIHNCVETVHNRSIIVVFRRDPSIFQELTLQNENVTSIIYKTWVVVEGGKEVTAKEAAEKCNDFVAAKPESRKRKAEDVAYNNPTPTIRTGKQPVTEFDDHPLHWSFEPLNDDTCMPTTVEGIRAYCKEHVPTMFTEFVHGGLDGLKKDLLNILPFFWGKYLPAWQIAKGGSPKTEIHSWGMFGSFMHFVGYGFVKTIPECKVTRQQAACILFDTEMYLRPPQIQDALAEDMIVKNPKVYIGKKPGEKYAQNGLIMDAVREFIIVKYSRLIATGL